MQHDGLRSVRVGDEIDFEIEEARPVPDRYRPARALRRHVSPGGVEPDDGGGDAFRINAFGIEYEARPGSRPPSSPGPPERVTAETAQRAHGWDLAAALTAARTRLGLVALLLALAGIGWWWTSEQMRGMDAGPWTALGALGWFLGVWVVMMVAMMFPSVAPTVALYGRMTSRHSLLQPLLFAAGYLLTWTAAGLLVFELAFAGGRVAGDVLAWDRAGQWIAGVTLLVAAGYELTPLKDVCLGKCRSPLGSLLTS